MPPGLRGPGGLFPLTQVVESPDRVAAARSATNNQWRRLLDRTMRGRETNDLKRSALVFSPHPDDETLGCGGTIIRKLEHGATVHVAYLTDGAQSHVPLMDSKVVKSMRHLEALDACGELGLSEAHVHFIDLPDGHLAEHGQEAVDNVRELLDTLGPEEVFVTHRDEAPADHRSANSFVRQAVEVSGSVTVIWEYPIWRWNSWPWLGLGEGSWHHPWAVAKAVSKGLSSLSLLTGCNCAVEVSQVLDRKRAALEMHRSQMVRINGDQNWDVLSDYSDGRFLEMLFQPHEAFRRYMIPGNRRV
jgi:LmbE family N-acetylglucosaminyl deacetylase